MNLYFNGPRSVFLLDPDLVGYYSDADIALGPILPSQGSGRAPEVNVNELSFGDGYTEYSASGLNTVRNIHNLVFTNRNKHYINAMERFLTGEGSSSIYYRSPEEWFWWTPIMTRMPAVPVPYKFVCLKWSITDNQGNTATLNATFTRVFTP